MTRALAPRNALGDALFLTGRLLHCRLLASQRDFSSHRLYLMASIAGSMLFCLIFIGTYAGMRELEAANAAGLIATIAAWAFLVYLFTDLFIAFGQALNDLYLSSDLALLFSLPLRGPSIIGAKFVLGVLQNEVYVGVFLLPFVFGFLLGVGAQWWAYPLALIGVAFFPAILYAALVVVTVVVLRVVPARVAKELLWLAGAAIPTMFWIVSFSRVARANGDIATMRLPPPPIWLPSTWLGHAVTFLGLGRVGPALEWLALLAVVTLVMGPIALAIVAKSFDAGFDANASRAAAVGAAEFTRLAGKPAHPLAALLHKDFLCFVRSPQLWFNHIAALGFVGYLLVVHKFQTPLIPLTTQLAMLQMGFVAALNSLNPGMIALSLEHGAIWILQSAPMRARDVLVGKIAGAYAQTAAISGTGAILLSVGYGFNAWRSGAIVLFTLLIAAAAIARGVAFDTAYPSFTWENPNAINRGVRMVLPFLNSLGILAVCAVALAGARVAYGPGAGGVIVGLTLSALLAALIILRGVRGAMKNLAALEV